jgi:hypothetical protein
MLAYLIGFKTGIKVTKIWRTVFIASGSELRKFMPLSIQLFQQ